jgi:hypothetical protein
VLLLTTLSSSDDVIFTVTMEIEAVAVGRTLLSSKASIVTVADDRVASSSAIDAGTDVRLVSVVQFSPE